MKKKKMMNEKVALHCVDVVHVVVVVAEDVVEDESQCHNAADDDDDDDATSCQGGVVGRGKYCFCNDRSNVAKPSSTLPPRVSKQGVAVVAAKGGGKICARAGGCAA